MRPFPPQFPPAKPNICSLTPPTPYLPKSPLPPGLLPHRARPALASIRLLGLGLGHPLGQDLSILIRLVFHLLSLAALERDAVALVLETLRCDQALDASSMRK